MNLLSTKNLAAFADLQDLAYSTAKKVASQLTPGITEKEAAQLLEEQLKQSGVDHFFHRCFAWFGDRSRFGGFRGYRDFLPSDRALQEGDTFILDVAPIRQGIVADIGYSGRLSETHENEAATELLRRLRQELPRIFENAPNAALIWEQVDQVIKTAGFENCHEKYPFSVLAHRLRPLQVSRWSKFSVPFGQLSWFHGHSYWMFLKRGIFPELMRPSTRTRGANLYGLWAVEPHVGFVPREQKLHQVEGSLGRRHRKRTNPTGGFGMKFEEMLWFDKNGARWVSPQAPWATSF